VLERNYALHSDYNSLSVIGYTRLAMARKKTAFVYIVWQNCHISRNESEDRPEGIYPSVHTRHIDSFSPWLIVVVGSHQFNRTQLKKIQREKED